MRLRSREDWRVTETAAMLWVVVAAMVLGGVAEVAFGHPVVVMP
jgi:hypothetical protein